MRVNDKRLMAQPQLWRYIPPLNLDGVTQMVIDEWLLIKHQQDNHPPTLRFYTFHPVALSLGISQRQKIPHHWHNLIWQGEQISLIQRPSGGRGVLHQGDLTYALITSHLEGNLEQVYRQICQFLIVGWAKLGINLHFSQPCRQYMRSPNCFSLATNADLIDSQGNKFIGNAQLRKGKYLLQHGSIMLHPNPELFEQVFPTFKLAINEQVQYLSLQKIMMTLKETVEQCFHCQLRNHPLSSQEWEQINQLKVAKNSA